MPFDIKEIQARFPHPRTSTYRFYSEEDYCVGGAILLFYGINSSQTFCSNFPDVASLACHLRTINSRLTEEKSLEYAWNIVIANDKECFDEAWIYAASALQFAGE